MYRKEPSWSSRAEKFNPHVTIGLATQDYLKKMVDEKFESFTFSPTGASGGGQAQRSSGRST